MVIRSIPRRLRSSMAASERRSSARVAPRSVRRLAADLADHRLDVDGIGLDGAGAAHVADRPVADEPVSRLLAPARAAPLARSEPHAVAREHLALVGVVDLRQGDALAGDVAPDVELGPVGQREHAHVLTRGVAAVVELPQLGPLAPRVPGAERVAQAEHPLLGAGLLLVAAAAAEDGVELALLDGVEQRHRLQGVAGAVGALAEPAVVDVVLHARDDEPDAQPLDGARRGSRAPRGSCARCPRAAVRTAAARGRRPSVPGAPSRPSPCHRRTG